MASCAGSCGAGDGGQVRSGREGVPGTRGGFAGVAGYEM